MLRLVANSCTMLRRPQKVRTEVDNIAGVKLPTFVPEEKGADVNELTGLSRGGEKIKDCKEQWLKCIKVLIVLASLQTSFRTLDESIKSTNRRVNAIEHVIIPKQVSPPLHCTQCFACCVWPASCACACACCLCAGCLFAAACSCCCCWQMRKT